MAQIIIQTKVFVVGRRIQEQHLYYTVVQCGNPSAYLLNLNSIGAHINHSFIKSSKQKCLLSFGVSNTEEKHVFFLSLVSGFIVNRAHVENKPFIFLGTSWIGSTKVLFFSGSSQFPSESRFVLW